MAVPSSSRQVAVHHVGQPGQQQQVVQQQRRVMSPYTPTTEDLRLGSTKSRLLLALRSGIDSEVDWALPRMVLASYEKPEFQLEHMLDSVTALSEWPVRWLEELEQEAAYMQLLRNGADSPKARMALGAVPAWSRNPATEARATYSLQVLRNASFSGNNPRTISRTSFVKYIFRFFNLPHELLLEVATRSPEPIQHLLVIIRQIYDYLFIGEATFKLLTVVLPRLAMDTRDLGLWKLIFPILISTFQVPQFPAPPDGFLQHILYLLTLNPPSPLLELVLDLLATMVPLAPHARTILSDHSFPAYLKTLVQLLEYQARPTNAVWDPQPRWRAHDAPNPAGLTAQAERSTLMRKAQREADQAKMEMFGGPGVQREVGSTAPQIAPSIKKQLYVMTEPKRSIAWMQETFVYSSSAQLLQMTFWHAYRDFFSNPATLEQLLSASEVIKNVHVAFPAAQAKLWTDENGDQKFVIAGLGFRKRNAEADRYLCMWNGCNSTPGCVNPGELLDHVQKQHLATGAPTQCLWGSCRHSPFSIGHLLTHLPLAAPLPVPDSLPVDASTPLDILSHPIITHRAPPMLGRKQQLHFVAQVTPHDQMRTPTGVAFLAALTVRGLARNLRLEVAAALPEEVGMSDAQRQEKKRHLAEERFGLPIPASVLREEEEEEDEARGLAEAAMPPNERERARAAFRAVEEKIIIVASTNFSGLGQYLGDAVGW